VIDTAGNPIPIDTLSQQEAFSSWQLHDIKVSDHIDPLTLDHIEFRISDQGQASILEGAIDHFFVSEGEYIGLDENTFNNQIKIYPNPFENEIVILSPAVELNAYSLYDASMRKVDHSMISSSNYRIQLPSGMESGIYFLRLQSKDGKIFSRKLIKR
jgi:hypothetical protein